MQLCLHIFPFAEPSGHDPISGAPIARQHPLPTLGVKLKAFRNSLYMLQIRVRDTTFYCWTLALSSDGLLV